MINIFPYEIIFHVCLTTGLLGVVMEAFFNYDEGIFGKTPKAEKLGIQLAGSIAIAAWSAFWSFLVFYSLKMIRWHGGNLLRLDQYTGNGLLPTIIDYH